MRTVDTELKLVLVDSFEDKDGLFWHHRVLVVKGEPGVWIVATPTLGVQRVDLKGKVPRLACFATFGGRPFTSQKDAMEFWWANPVKRGDHTL